MTVPPKADAGNDDILSLYNHAEQALMWEERPLVEREMVCGATGNTRYRLLQRNDTSIRAHREDGSLRVPSLQVSEAEALFHGTPFFFQEGRNRPGTACGDGSGLTLMRASSHCFCRGARVERSSRRRVPSLSRTESRRGRW